MPHQLARGSQKSIKDAGCEGAVLQAGGRVGKRQKGGQADRRFPTGAAAAALQPWLNHFKTRAQSVRRGLACRGAGELRLLLTRP